MNVTNGDNDHNCIILPDHVQLLPHIVSVILSLAGGRVGPIPGIMGDHLDPGVIEPLPVVGEEHPAIGGG